MFKLDYNNMLDEYIGEEGIHLSNIESYEEKIKQVHEGILNSEFGFEEILYKQDEVIDDILKYTDEIKSDIENFVVVGIGGSALGPKAVHYAINGKYYNEKKDKNYPNIYFSETVDPDAMKELFDTIDLSKTLFNIITKSGSTSETMSQFLIIEEMLIKEGLKPDDHLVCTTSNKMGDLYKIAKEKEYKMFFIPENVGGRFSELTPVGLLPAAITGINIKQLLNGAKKMAERCKDVPNPAYMYGLLQHLEINRGKNISVLMPYADRLKYITDWYVQLWAESLGKRVDFGQTPVSAMGPVDQHSKIQLFVDGPNDKVITFISVLNYKNEINIPRKYEDVKGANYLGGNTLNRLIKTEKFATEYALTKHNKSNMSIIIDRINEETIGEIIYFFELATVFLAKLEKINPFNQPGVEDGKNAIYSIFEKPGYEEKRKELEDLKEKSEKFII